MTGSSLMLLLCSACDVDSQRLWHYDELPEGPQTHIAHLPRQMWLAVQCLQRASSSASAMVRPTAVILPHPSLMPLAEA